MMAQPDYDSDYEYGSDHSFGKFSTCPYFGSLKGVERRYDNQPLQENPRQENPKFRTPQMEALVADDVKVFRTLLDVEDQVENMFLHEAVLRQRRQVFDFLISVYSETDMRLNAENLKGLTPLLCAAKLEDQHFALELIKHGAAVNTIDATGKTSLHYATKESSQAVVEALINNGAYVNYGDSQGDTPLHIACKDNSPMVTALLYHGADATIPNAKGETPLDHTLMYCPPDIQEIVYDYTYDNFAGSVSLRTVLIAMIHAPRMFFKLIENNCIVFDETHDEFELLNNNLSQIRFDVFEEFMDVCPTLVEEFFEEWNPLDTMPTVGGLPETKFFYMLCKTPYIQDICQNHQNDMCLSILRVVKYSERIAIPFLCSLLSYGFRMSSEDLFEIYWLYGYGELFSILLHMGLQPKDWYEDMFYDNPHFILPALIQDFKLSPNVLYSFPENETWFFDEMRTLFTHPVISRHQEDWCGSGQRSIPSLTEMARESSRWLLINKFKVRTDVQFFTMLKNLRVHQHIKDILSYKRPVYRY